MRSLVVAALLRAVPATDAFVLNPPVGNLFKRAMPMASAVGEEVVDSSEAATQPIPGPAHWDNAAWQAGFVTPRDELAVTLESLTAGSLPDDLVGTYYRAGPAQFEAPGSGERVMHPLDADGMVTAATFLGNGTVYFRNRFVRTLGFQKERRAGKSLYPGQYGNAKAVWAGGGLGAKKNVANENVIWWGGRLLALWSGGRPYKLDPLSLGTAGETDVGQTVLKGEPFASRPRVDVDSNRLVAFGVKPNPLTGATVRLCEYTDAFQNVNEAGKVTEFALPPTVAPDLCKDFALTRSWAIFSAAPLGLDRSGVAEKSLKVLLGQTPAASSLEFDGSQPARLVFLRRSTDGGKRAPIFVEVDTHVPLAHVNAFEDSSNPGLVTLDLVTAERPAVMPLSPASSGWSGGKNTPLWETLDYTKEVPKASLKRYTIDVRKPSLMDTEGDPLEGQLIGKLVGCEMLTERHVELPTINPRYSTKAHRYVWAACTSASPADAGGDHSTAAPAQGILKIDTKPSTEGGDSDQVWIPMPHQFCGEPCFVPRKGGAGAEDDGYIVTFLVDGKAGDSELLVLDAAQVARGPIARIPIGTNIAHGQRGCWAEAVPSLADASAEDQLLALKKAKVLLDLYERKSREWNQVDAGFSGLGIVQFFGQKGIDGR